MVRELADNLDTFMPSSFMRGAAKTRSVEQCAVLLSDFLMPSDRFGALEFSNEGRDVYSLEVSDCRFAKRGMHARFRASGIICPMALLFAAFVQRAMKEVHVTSISASMFEPRSSLTRMRVGEPGEEDNSSSSGEPEAIGGRTLDRIDLDILRFVQGNARLSNVDIARALRTSEATVRRRIQALVDRGVIRGFVARIDHGQVRRKIKIHLALEVSSDRIDAVVGMLLARPELCSLYRSMGEYNLVCEFLMNDVSSMQMLVDEISKSKGVLKTNSIIATSPLKPCPWFD